MNKMFLIFDKHNGSITHVCGIKGVSLVILNNLYMIGELHDGEYCHVGHFTIVCSTGGVTTDELLARNIK